MLPQTRGTALYQFEVSQAGVLYLDLLSYTGFANQPTSLHRDDGLALKGAWVGAAVRCAPPDNKPTNEERDGCRQYLRRELDLLPDLRVVVCLGNFAYQAATEYFGIRPRPKFGHGVEVTHESLTLICSFHPSQQNTFTGKLTEPMIDAVFARARELVD